jgi:hypothetical protein
MEDPNYTDMKMFGKVTSIFLEKSFYLQCTQMWLETIIPQTKTEFNLY